jgi:hypothetical protein
MDIGTKQKGFRMKVVMNLSDEIIIKMKDFIKKSQYTNMTSLINDAIHDYISRNHEPQEKIYELDELQDLDFEKSSHATEQNKIKNDSHDSNDMFAAGRFGPLYDYKMKLKESAKHFAFIASKTVNNRQDGLKIHDFDQPLWGQINRIFPLKVALRHISHLSRSESGLIDIGLFKENENFIKRLADYGNMLNQIDKDGKRGKSRRLSTGFPIGDIEYKLRKSMARFQSHFVFEIRKDNLVTGGLAKMKFLELCRNDGEGTKVSITKAGNKFAKLSNPLLDDDPIFSGKDVGQFINMSDEEKISYLGKDCETLSYKEKAFIINHVKESYPAEYNAIKTLLNNINKGENSPASLKSSMQTYLADGLSESALATVVNGLVSRCAELGLLDKTKEGLNVTYHVSNAGKSLIS